MITAISTVTNGIQLGLTRFDDAAAAVVKSVAHEEVPAPKSEDFVSSTANLIAARAAVQASLKAAKAFNDMVSEVLALGSYSIAPRATD